MENVAGIYCKGWATVTFSILATIPVILFTLFCNLLCGKKKSAPVVSPCHFQLSIDLVT
jgi:hypothetical protein